MRAGEALRRAAQRLAQAGVPDARHDARALLGEVMNLAPLEVLAAQDRPLDEAGQARFFDLVARRAAREPLQYLLGRAYFMGHAFAVAPGVLIPRQDSEALAQRALALAGKGARILDLCCGSGCLGISLKLARPDAEVHAGDIAPEAIRLTRDNALRLGADIRLRQGDLFAPFEGLKFDVIVCNPPYVPTDELPHLQAEVRYEPALALDGGPDGLAFYRRLLSCVACFLNPGGRLLLEAGDGQADALRALVPRGFAPPRVHPDLACLPRVLETGLPDSVE
ncbi:MAG: peptide chain release factor N(5)-glutamine methyltransferase [Christensenellales bacterium]